LSYFPDGGGEHHAVLAENSGGGRCCITQRLRAPVHTAESGIVERFG